MAFEEFRLQLSMLLDEIAGNPKDAHELQESLREKLTEMHSLGPVSYTHLTLPTN